MAARLRDEVVSREQLRPIVKIDIGNRPWTATGQAGASTS
jgi:hypothetical protein